MLNKQSGNLTLNTALGAVSPGYEINDLGFQYRSDNINYHLATGLPLARAHADLPLAQPQPGRLPHLGLQRSTRTPWAPGASGT